MFTEIDIHKAKKLMDAGSATIVDIRSPENYQESHIQNSILLKEETVDNFLQSADKRKAIICYCYHGYSSKSAAHFFITQGFTEVYSLKGGFEEWRVNYPVIGHSDEAAK